MLESFNLILGTRQAIQMGCRCIRCHLGAGEDWDVSM